MSPKTSAPTTIPAQPRLRASGRETLNELIDSILARTREADPHVIARRYFSKLAPEMLQELALVGFTDRVSQRMAFVRTGGVAAPTRTVGKSKWQIAQRVWVAGEHKLLADCNLSDLAQLAEQHRDIAARNLSRAEEYDRLAQELRNSGCPTVGKMWAAEGLAA